MWVLSSVLKDAIYSIVLHYNLDVPTAVACIRIGSLASSSCSGRRANKIEIDFQIFSYINNYTG